MPQLCLGVRAHYSESHGKRHPLLYLLPAALFPESIRKHAGV